MASPELRIACVPSQPIASSWVASSSRERTSLDWTLTPNWAPASCIAFTSRRFSGRAGFQSAVACVSFGTVSFSSATRLALSSSCSPETPVMLPPGRARLWARPAATGSPVAAMTIGIVLVNFLADNPSGVHIATMTSTLLWTSASMMASSSAGLPCASRCSSTKFLPSIQPSWPIRSRNDSE